MSNIRAISGSSKIVHRNQGGGSKLQGIPSSTNLNTSAHVAFRNRNVVCACNRDIIFCMNQLGGVGAGGIPGRSYAFAPGADGTRKQFYCGHRFNYYLNNNKHLIYPKSIELNIDNDEDLISSDRDTLNIQRSNVVHSERAKPTTNISIGKINVYLYKYIKGYKLTSTTTPGEFELGPPTGKTIKLVNKGTYMLKRNSTEIYYIEVLVTQPEIIIKRLRIIKTKTEVDKLRENELYIVNSATNIAIQRTYTLLTYSYPELYIQNIGEGSNMYFYNTYALAPKLEKNKLYKLTVSIINVTVIFTVTTIGAPGNPYSKYIIDILYEVNFANQSATFGNPNNQAIYVVGQTVRTFNGDQPVIQLFVGN